MLWASRISRVSANELRLMIKLGSKAGIKKMGDTLSGVTLVDVDDG